VVLVVDSLLASASCCVFVSKEAFSGEGDCAVGAVLECCVCGWESCVACGGPLPL